MKTLMFQMRYERKRVKSKIRNTYFGQKGFLKNVTGLKLYLCEHEKKTIKNFV